MTDDTSHFPIAPCAPLEQSPVGESARQAVTACWSSILDCEENRGVVAVVLQVSETGHDDAILPQEF